MGGRELLLLDEISTGGCGLQQVGESCCILMESCCCCCGGGGSACACACACRACCSGRPPFHPSGQRAYCHCAQAPGAPVPHHRAHRDPLAFSLCLLRAGLDSATTSTVCKYLGDLSRTMGVTAVVSLLQPSGDVLALFDDVMLLAGGWAAAPVALRCVVVPALLCVEMRAGAG